MEEAISSDELDDESEDEFLPAQKKFSGKKLVLYILLPVLLAAGTGVGLVVSGVFAGGADTEVAKSNAFSTQAVFYDLPEMLVNLNTSGRRPTFLKMKVSLEIAKKSDEDRLKALSPRIIDNFQVYLRELRIEDLRGSAGIYRLREELLARVNAAVHPVVVKDVLFKEMLIQ